MPPPAEDTTAAPELAVRWEERDWEPRAAAATMLRSDRARIGRPYRAAVPPAIAAMPFVLAPDVVGAAEDVRAEITRFDADLGATFPGEFAPLASILLRTESASSSQIENITAGSRALALAELGLTQHGSNAQLVVANVEAMQRAIELADQITPDAILAVHAALMRGQGHAGPGAYRDEQVWIGGHNASPHDAAFVPPHPSRVEPAIDDLCAFVHRTDLPLMAQAAIAHAQFETIHPFNDGNGRTGRALVHAMLKHGNATTRTTVPVSAGLLSATSTYFDALTAYREGDPNAIVTRFNEAAIAAIVNGRHLATDLHDIDDQWRDQLTARSDSAAWRILPVLLSQPAVTSHLVQLQTGVSQPAADRALRQLADAGIVHAKNEQGEQRRRNVVWRADAVIEALDAFAERARRRTPT